jgi:hypothetical protein
VGSSGPETIAAAARQRGGFSTYPKEQLPWG